MGANIHTSRYPGRPFHIIVDSEREPPGAQPRVMKVRIEREARKPISGLHVEGVALSVGVLQPLHSVSLFAPPPAAVEHLHPDIA